MAAAAILKSQKIAVSLMRFDRFPPNLARQHSSALFSRPTVKNFSMQDVRQHNFKY